MGGGFCCECYWKFADYSGLLLSLEALNSGEQCEGLEIAESHG